MNEQDKRDILGKARVKMMETLREAMERIEETLEDIAEDALLETHAGSELAWRMLSDEEGMSADEVDAWYGKINELVKSASRGVALDKVNPVWVTVTPQFVSEGLSIEVEVFSERPKFDDPEFSPNFPDPMWVYEGNIDGGDTEVIYGP